MQGSPQSVFAFQAGCIFFTITHNHHGSPRISGMRHQMLIGRKDGIPKSRGADRLHPVEERVVNLGYWGERKIEIGLVGK